MNKKKLNNNGFSLVELIIVIAIMAVLIGVLAPTYMQYVEKSKKSNDVSTVDSIAGACEVIAVDPEVTWTAGDAGKLTITLKNADNMTVTGKSGENAADKLKEIVPDTTKLKASWGSDIEITAVKGTNGKITYTCTSAVTSYSSSLKARLGL